MGVRVRDSGLKVNVPFLRDMVAVIDDNCDIVKRNVFAEKTNIVGEGDLNAIGSSCDERWKSGVVGRCM